MGGAENRKELELFLKNMFMDKNILPIPFKFLRFFISRLITYFRIDNSYKNYEAIGGSPLKRITESISKKLEKKLKMDVFSAYRYLPPFSGDVIKKIGERNIKEVFLLPFYPHFSFTTYKSSVEDFKENFERSNLECDLYALKPFYRENEFNELIVKSIMYTLDKNEPEKFSLIFSAHSIPQKFLENGDTYKFEIEEHVEILKELFRQKNIKFRKILLSYQSKIGPVKWLSPSVEEVLRNLKGESVLIYPISFVIDNVETLYELSIFYRDRAREFGLKEYKVVKCINDSDDFVYFLSKYIKNTL